MYAWLIGTFIRRSYRRALAGNPAMLMSLAAEDIEFVFPGNNSFAGRYRGTAQLRAWLERLAALDPDFHIEDVVVSGAPWNVRIAVRFRDAIGEDYHNEGVEYLRVRRGRLRRVEVFVDTEKISAWESRHPEIALHPTG